MLESVIGAIYLDGGLEPASKFILKNMIPHIDAVIANQHKQNYKSILQQHCQRLYGSTPEYELLDEQGPDHSKAFEVGVFCNGYRYPTAWGNNKKDAEQLAAQAALTELGVLEVQEDIEQ